MRRSRLRAVLTESLYAASFAGREGQAQRRVPAEGRVWDRATMPCPGEWRNWQTRRLQVPVSLRSWGFKSPLAHDVFPNTAPRRRGRRRTAVVLIFVTLVAVILLATGELRNDTRTSIAYLVKANDAVASYRDLSQRFDGQVLMRLPLAQREDVALLMDQYAKAAESSAEGVRSLEPPASVAGAAAALDIALDSWQQGLQTFAASLFAVVDVGDEASVDQLGASLVAFEVGDAAYVRFLDAVDELGATMDLPVEFPQVAFLPPGVGSLRHAAGIIAVAQDAGGMELRRDLEVSAVKLDPQEVGTDDGGDLVLPATDSLLVRASVGNRGNQNEDEIRVSVTLQAADGAVLYQETADVDTLEPRASTTVEFSALPVVAGERFTILVAVSVLPGDIDTGNNVRQLEIRVNEPS